MCVVVLAASMQFGKPTKLLDKVTEAKWWETFVNEARAGHYKSSAALAELKQWIQDGDVTLHCNSTTDWTFKLFTETSPELDEGPIDAGTRKCIFFFPKTTTKTLEECFRLLWRLPLFGFLHEQYTKGPRKGERAPGKQHNIRFELTNDPVKDQTPRSAVQKREKASPPNVYLKPDKLDWTECSFRVQISKDGQINIFLGEMFDYKTPIKQIDRILREGAIDRTATPHKFVQVRHFQILR